MFTAGLMENLCVWEEENHKWSVQVAGKENKVL